MSRKAETIRRWREVVSAITDPSVLRLARDVCRETEPLTPEDDAFITSRIADLEKAQAIPPAKRGFTRR